MAIATTGKDVLAKFFDEGAYSALYADGAVTAAFGSANGTPVYAVCQDVYKRQPPAVLRCKGRAEDVSVSMERRYLMNRECRRRLRTCVPIGKMVSYNIRWIK